MQITPYHAKYFAHELTKQSASDSIQKFAATLVDAQVDLNPHQVEAALFAFRSPLSKGALLADEVGLGKTIEAGLVISQKWAERKRQILIISPSSLRKQWNQELADKFFIPSVVIEAKFFNREIKNGNLNPFQQKDNIVICSYHFARNKDSYVRLTDWDLVVIDEAHKLRNVYKPANQIANAIKNALQGKKKLLLTATPLQNSLLELYGLVSIIDDYAFGDFGSFRQRYSANRTQEAYLELRERLQPICKRTLRRDVLEYINYTNRIAVLQEYFPTDEEQKLYTMVSEYLQRENLYALPRRQRSLMTLIMRKLLASSSYAIAGTLKRLQEKLEKLLKDQTAGSSEEFGFNTDYDAYDETKNEWTDEVEEDGEVLELLTPEELEQVQEEIDDLREIGNLSRNILKNSKGEALLTALKTGFAELEKQPGAHRKAMIFTESRRTQDYLKELLTNNGYAGEVVLFNGTNNSQETKTIYKDWLKKHQGTERISGAKSADTRAALVEHFREEGTIMIATEAAAEGINLQFCSLLVNYDLPWNPQRIEQRIGRCHRYGQKFDVVVINFLNKRNAADQRVYELLNEKFQLFDGVFGASDEVLGSIESGIDFEKRIAAIYQNCRSENEIQSSFDALQQEMEESINEKMEVTKLQLLDNFDEEVHEKLRVSLRESTEYKNKYENWLWQITKSYLQNTAVFSTDTDYSFELLRSPFSQVPTGNYRIGKNKDDAYVYRIGHPLAQGIIKESKSAPLSAVKLTFDYTGTQKIISILESFVGKSGWLSISNLTLDSFESEDRLIFAAFADTGESLDADQCSRLFSLPAEVTEINTADIPQKNLTEITESQQGELLQETAERNSIFFDEEIDKLDNWAEDIKKGLEINLKNLEKEIKTRKTEARKIPVLAEKVKEQKRIKQLEKRRTQLRRDIHIAQDDIEDKKETLIDEVEERMKQQATLKTLFTVRWELI